MSSNLIPSFAIAGLAQLKERLIRNQEAVSLILTTGTIKKKRDRS